MRIDSFGAHSEMITDNYVVPVAEDFDVVGDRSRRDGELRRRVRYYDDGSVYCNMTSYSCASKWDGKPEYQTASNCGH